MLFNSCYFIVPVKHLICVTESNNSRYNQSVIASNVGCYANNKFNIIEEDGVARGVQYCGEIKNKKAVLNILKMIFKTLRKLYIPIIVRHQLHSATAIYVHLF